MLPPAVPGIRYIILWWCTTLAVSNTSLARHIITEIFNILFDSFQATAAGRLLKVRNACTNLELYYEKLLRLTIRHYYFFILQTILILQTLILIVNKPRPPSLLLGVKRNTLHLYHFPNHRQKEFEQIQALKKIQLLSLRLRTITIP